MFIACIFYGANKDLRVYRLLGLYLLVNDAINPEDPRSFYSLQDRAMTCLFVSVS